MLKHLSTSPSQSGHEGIKMDTRALQPQRPAVIYSRVSSKDQEKEGFSIPAQMELLRSYAIEAGIAVLQEFVDVETARQGGRSGFGEMIAFFKKNKSCRVLLVEKTDRLYRNLKDWVT